MPATRPEGLRRLSGGTAGSIHSGQVGPGSGIRRFWTSTAMVPVAEAGWFTDLVARAGAAPEVRAG